MNLPTIVCGTGDKTGMKVASFISMFQQINKQVSVKTSHDPKFKLRSQVLSEKNG